MISLILHAYDSDGPEIICNAVHAQSTWLMEGTTIYERAMECLGQGPVILCPYTMLNSFGSTGIRVDAVHFVGQTSGDLEATVLRTLAKYDLTLSSSTW
jgi:hypothetical protein